MRYLQQAGADAGKSLRSAPGRAFHYSDRGRLCSQAARPGCPNSAWLKNSGDPGYSNVGIDFKVIIDTIKDLIGKGESPNIAEIALDAVPAFDGTGRLKYNMKWHLGGCPSSDAADDYYPGLFSLGHFLEDFWETEVNSEGPDYFAKQHFKKNPLTRVMVMGTRTTISWSGPAAGKTRFI